MKKTLKKALSVLLVCAMLLSVQMLAPITAGAYSIPSESAFASKIASLQSTFVNGQYWNKYSSSDYSRTGTTPCQGRSNYDGATCISHGYCAYGGSCTCTCGAYVENGVEKAWQCMGFAYKMAYLSFGVSPISSSSWKTSYSLGTVYAGDIIRINNNVHSIFVYKVDGATIYYADCNRTGPCKVSWGNTISYSSLSSKFTYKKHLDGNTLSGKGESAVANAWVKAEKSRLVTGDSNTFTFGADNATSYNIRVDKDGSLWKYQEGVKSGLSYTFSDAGSYCVWIAGHNSSSYKDSSKVYFTVFSNLNFGSSFYANITNVISGKMVTANDSDNVILQSKNGSDYQKWLFERQSDGSYKITNVKLNKCLDVYNGLKDNGTNIWVYNSNDTDAQRWYIVYNTTGYGLVPKRNVNSALDIYGGAYAAVADGTNIQEYVWNESAAQIFSIDYLSLTPSATTEYNGHKYEYYRNNTTWNQAYKFCEQQGGHLVTITSKAENDAMVSLTNGYSGGAWIGATNFGNNSAWYWINSEKYTENSFWNTGEPNNTNGIENCAGIYTSGANVGTWNDLPMLNSSVEGFICEYDDIVNAGNYTPKTSVTSGDYIYELYDYNVDWQTAKKICEEKGGTLVTITNASENSVVSGLIKSGGKSEYWIGLTDVESEGIWKWVDGNTASYTNWFSGDPNNDCAMEDYIAINKDSGQWYDLKGFSYSYRSVGFICQSKVRVEAQSISLNKTTTSLEVGNNETLTATVLPSDTVNKTITWTSSNTSVATVSNGKVTAKAEGTAIITAKTSNGKTATCTVTVKKPLNISASAASSAVTVGDMLKITANASGGSGGYTYSYLTYNATTKKWERLTASFGSSNVYTWKPTAAGSYQFYAEVKDSTGKTVRSAAVSVNANNPLTLTATAAGKSIAVGDTLKIRANASGGSGGYTYSYLTYNATTKKWERLTASFGSSNVYTWKPTAAGSYQFYAEVKDSTGKTVRSAAVSVQVTAKQSNLATPKITSAVSVYGGVKINWNSVAGAAKYRVFYKSASGWKRLGDTTATTITDTVVTSGKSYTYTVRCLSADSKSYTSSYDAAGITVTYVASPVVSKIENVTNGVKITWNKVAGAAKYRVFYKSASGWKKLGDTTSTTITDTVVSSGKSYIYTVRCMNSSGSYVSGYYANGWKHTYIASPVISSLKSTGKGVNITWGKVAGAAKYRVFVKNGSSWTKLGDTTSNTFTHTSAKSGTSYTYTVRCLSADGKSYTSGYYSGKTIKA